MVKPLRSHSLTSEVSTAVTLDASTKLSLMRLTVNSLVARIFSRVSFFRFEGKLKETLSIGGFDETCEDVARKVQSNF